MAKIRLDLLLVDQGIAATRSQAQALIMSGQVSADGRVLDKPGTPVEASIQLHVKRQAPFVSRAGEKLASVAPLLELNFTDSEVLDVGSSTGGFTDYALQNGARHVWCVDVGTGQLAQKLRLDQRVTVMEQTDIRNVRISPEQTERLEVVTTSQAASGQNTKILRYLPKPADIAVIDVSFISLQLVLPAVAPLVRANCPIIAMVKPQFEAGKEVADRYRGVIPLGPERDAIFNAFRVWLKDHNFQILDEIDSGLAGAQGNVERFFKLQYPG